MAGKKGRSKRSSSKCLLLFLFFACTFENGFVRIVLRGASSGVVQECQESEVHVSEAY